MDSLGRRSGRQMARLRRQRSQEWREREFSSSENDEVNQASPVSYPRYIVDDRMLQYEKEVKAGLDPSGRVVGTSLIPTGLSTERPRASHSPKVNTVGVGGLQTVENRTYAPLSGSDGDTETDNALHSPMQQMLLHHQAMPNASPTSSATAATARGRMSLNLRRGPSSSSSENNSDTTYPDSDLAMARALAMVASRNGSAESPPEPAPPEVPPRGISMHHGDVTNVVRARDVMALGSSPRAAGILVNVGGTSAVAVATSSPPTSSAKIEQNCNTSVAGVTGGHDRLGCSSSSNQLGHLHGGAALPCVLLPQTNTKTHSHGRSHGHNFATGQNNHQQGSSTTANNSMQQQQASSSAQQTSSQFSATSFHFRKSCSHRCSWKCLSIFLIFITVLLSAALTYFGAVSSMTHHLESNNGCILVEDAQLASVGLETTRAPTPKVAVQPPTRVAPNDHDLWPVVEVLFDHKASHEIPPYGFWNVRLRQTQAALVRLNFTIIPPADLVIFARRHVPPTITQYDLMETIRKHSPEGKRARSTRTGAEISVLHRMDPGWWFFSVYNDNNHPQNLTVVPELAMDVLVHCPNNCNGHGSCTLGRCECFQGYTGKSCEQGLCPVLCSNHGTYSGGVCHCERGWKGVECGVPEHDCEVADCNGHGECRVGVCFCNNGFKGRHCEEVDCIDPRCSEHGLCTEGQCICRPGWRGHNCSQADERLVQCLPDCSGHGTFHLDLGHCVCEKYWTGLECAEALCSADCGTHGKCIGGHCQCNDGWNGSKCNEKLCDSRCAEHGQCNNGSCVCMQGWNGKHCTLEGCPRDCSHHGDCTTTDAEYQCNCYDGWDGEDCSVQLEKICNDRLDNDNDGVVDCADSECCDDPVCQDHLMCVTTADPVDVLYRKQPPAVTASFYQRMKFLIEDSSVQSYVHKDEFSENRVSVIRGRVVNRLRQGLIGIRVGVESEPKLGFTVSREQGWFDIMVNGGGAVTLQFQQSLLRPTKMTIMVPWNQIVVMDQEVIMVTPTEELPLESSPKHPECVEHDYEFMRPSIHETWIPGMVGGCPESSVIYAETQVVQESIEIPGSDLHLLYQSSSAAGYHGTLHIQLTQADVPSTLKVLHLRVMVEGVLVTKKFEADPNVTYTFTWNKRNIYKQKVYGVAVATVSVGYEYSSCRTVVWVTQTSTLQGYDMDISDIGGWNLDIHHRYNFQDGILQKGDGTTVYFSRQPSIVQVVMGRNDQRPLLCTTCDGVAKESKLLAPVALASGADGSVFVGDFNLIRRITPKGNVRTLLQLSATQTSYYYHLVIHPVDGSLYMSNPEQCQILKLRAVEGTEDLNSYTEVVVGNGERCLLGDHRVCGDGGLASDAKLTYPKGMAIGWDGELFFADGTNIRVVDKKGIVHTLIGGHSRRLKRVPLPCTGGIPVREVQLLWPTEIALSPLDRALYFIDDNLILKLTSDRRVIIVAGRPMHCHGEPDSGHSSEHRIASKTTLGSLIGMAFAPNGNLLFAEVNSRKVNLIHAVKPDGLLEHVAGTLHPKRECSASNCSACHEPRHSLSINSFLCSVSAITTTPDGVVYVADGLRILSLVTYFPKPNQLGDYEILFPDTHELYVFNRYGQHTATRNVLTGKNIYHFLYSVNTSFGKLNTVTDAPGNKVSFLRDISSKVYTIENAQGLKYMVKISKIGLMEGLTTYSNFEIAFEYHGSSGLLSSRTDSAGNTYVYVYDDDGRLSEASTPTGIVTRLVPGMSSEGATVTVYKNDLLVSKLVMAGTSLLKTTKGSGTSEIRKYLNGSVSMTTPWDFSSEVISAPHPGLEMANSIQSEMFFAPVQWSARSGNHGANIQWKLNILGDIRAPEKIIERQLWVNKSRVLTMEYEQAMLREVIYDRDKYSIFAVQYDSAGKPTQWVPTVGGFPVSILYDRFGRLSSWLWGRMGEEYVYDRLGLLIEIKNEDGASFRIKYSDHSLPVKYSLPSGREFELHYDHHGNLKHVTMPKGGRHSFSLQLSIGFIKLLYTPLGSHSPLTLHYSDDGHLLELIYPENHGRILYRYGNGSRLESVVYGISQVKMEYYDVSGLLREVQERHGDFESHVEYKYDGLLVAEERLRYGSRTGLNQAKFAFEYDDLFRLISFRGRIGPQDIPATNLTYDPRSGLLSSVGPFKIVATRPNETVVHDGVAVFTRVRDSYFRTVQLTLVIHGTEVYRLEVGYDNRNRVIHIRTQLRKIGAMTTSSDAKNYTYDADGQLREVHAHDTWRFDYDAHGNMVAQTYQNNVIPLHYDDMDRISKYTPMKFKVDQRGFITQRGEEHFYYNAKGHMTRATQSGRYDVVYYYDHKDRLTVRKDHFGNITQFFYVNTDAPFEVSYIYNPRDGRTVTLIYDDRGLLVFTRVGANRYYVATDPRGTPLIVFNHYGEAVREMHRSPFGHIVYDSNPFIYLPIDYQGGILDTVTSLIHLRGRVYDPLIGHWMTPRWEEIVQQLSTPYRFHLYRINNNDPVNQVSDKWFLTDHLSWLRHLGYDGRSFAPHLNSLFGDNGNGKTDAEICLTSTVRTVSGVRCNIRLKESGLAAVSIMPRLLIKKETALHRWVPRVAAVSPPVGFGIVVSRVDERAVVRAAGGADPIVRDVVTSVLNQSFLMDLRLVQHHRDVFYFVKENLYQVTEDLSQLQRLGSAVNITVHESKATETDKDIEHIDVKLHTMGAVLSIRYGTSYQHDRSRVLRHAKHHAVSQAWARERDLLRQGYSGSRDWSTSEVEQVLQSGNVPGFHGEYIHDVNEFPELAEDPSNIAFLRGGGSSGASTNSGLGPITGSGGSGASQKHRRR